MLGSYGRSQQDKHDDIIYAKAGRRILDNGGGFGNYFQLEFQKSLDRHSAAIERLAAAIEIQNGKVK